MAVISPGSGICMTKVSSNSYANKINDARNYWTAPNPYPVLLMPAKKIPVLSASI
jgi:hypothetical protein